MTTTGIALRPSRIAVSASETSHRYDSTFTPDDRSQGVQELRDAAATLDELARMLARRLPAERTDVRADLAALREIAGNVRGYAGSMEVGA